MATAGTSWSELFDRRMLPDSALAAAPGSGAGRVGVWMKVTSDLGDDQFLQRCALAYLSDDLPTDAVIRCHPEAKKRYQSAGEFYADLGKLRGAAKRGWFR